MPLSVYVYLDIEVMSDTTQWFLNPFLSLTIVSGVTFFVHLLPHIVFKPNIIFL